MKNTILLFVSALLLSSNITAQPVPFTFSVDMSQETISPDGVHVAGDFQSEAGFDNDWNPGATALTDPDGDQIYEATVMVPPGTYLYKFVNGNEWNDKPELPSADCSISDGAGNFNRQAMVSISGLNLPVVQFDSCNAILHLSVNMSEEEVAPEGVFAVGDFQVPAGFTANWDPTTVSLSDVNNDGTYEAHIPVPPGDYQYLFVNGNTLSGIESPPADCTEDDGNGNLYRTATAIIGSNQTITYCFNSCTICDPAINPDYDTHWWNDAVFYEIFVRSFYDSDDDGIGDFQGMIDQLDYLNDGDPTTTDDLGITGIWLMPMMESPSYHGYDVTDYYGTEPDYGTMEEFEAFLEAAHDRGIKVIIDFVMNHSSSQHPWFTQSANNQNGYRDWYVWSDNNPGYQGPWGQTVWHNWGGDYYYGLFWGGMPDLNFSHPPVKEEIFNAAEFWLDKGIDGFRLDAIKYLDEDGSVLENTAETFQILEDFNDLYKANNPEAITVGEVWSNTASILPYIQNDRLDVCFEFDLAYSIINGINWNTPDPINNHIQTIQAGYPRLQYATFLTNHDIDRIYSQFGTDVNKMKQAALLYLTMPGVPFIYYGEEVGMTGTGAHENIRRPMQWSAGANAGFSSQTPWQAVGSNYTINNVATMEEDPNSLLEHYKQLIHLRNEQAALRRGYLLSLDNNSEGLLSYARIHEGEAVIVLSNFSNTSLTPNISMPISSLTAGEYYVTDLLTQEALGTITLNSLGGFVNWEPVAQNLTSRESWILSLSTDQTVNIVPDLDRAIIVNIYPNPATDIVNIQWNQAIGEEWQVQLWDYSGRLLRTDQFRADRAVLDVSDLSSGLYFIRVEGQGQVNVLPLAVEN
jgi:alpha-amylase